eukprot:3951383-Ditylum_brightwellii.AAC.1
MVAKCAITLYLAPCPHMNQQNTRVSLTPTYVVFWEISRSKNKCRALDPSFEGRQSHHYLRWFSQDPVGYHPDLLQSYRAKLTGILVAYYLVKCFKTFFEVQTLPKLLAHVDNISAVNMNNFDAAFPGVTAHTVSDVDLLLNIWRLKAEGIDLQTKWVEAHQDREHLNQELSEPANLNCMVNTDATAYMASPLCTPSIIPPVLHSSCAILIVGDIVVTS